jgi:hypothetical protein
LHPRRTQMGRALLFTILQLESISRFQQEGRAGGTVAKAGGNREPKLCPAGKEG